MIRSAVLTILYLLIQTTAVSAQAPDHPRLIIDEDLLEDLRSITDPIDDDQTDWETWSAAEKVSHLAFRSIAMDAEGYLELSVEHSTNSSGDWDEQGLRLKGPMVLAMAHLLRKGDTDYDDDNRYLLYLIDLFAEWADNPFPSNDLIAGEMTGGVALTLDWLYEDLNTLGKADDVAELLEALLNDDFDEYFETCKNDNNHLGVIYGGRGLAALALEDEGGVNQTLVDAELDLASSRVRDYFDAAFDDEGMGTEGVYYSIYGLQTALPFALATERLPHLPGSVVVNVTENENVQQAATWLLYEQLPYDPAIGTPLNDTQESGLNPQSWRTWPWLLAFRNDERPSGALHLFNTTYPPAAIDEAFVYEEEFDAELDVTPLENHQFGMLFSRRFPLPRNYVRTAFNPVAILLGYPQEPSDEAYLDPSEMRDSHAFVDEGIAYYKSSLHEITPSGTIDESLFDGTLVTFGCRNFTEWSVENDCEGDGTQPGRHQGHAHHDLTHFTVFSKGVPLFYDAGFAPNSPFTNDSRLSRGHNVLEFYHNAGWYGANGTTWREGAFLRALLPLGNAPQVVGGDRTDQWPYADEGLFLRARRHLFVMPRDGGQPPYLFLHDDTATNPSSRQIRWLWHSANQASDCPFVLDQTARRATIMIGEAAASATILSPTSGVTLSRELWNPAWDDEPDHELLIANLGTRTNADLAALIDIYDRPSVDCTPGTYAGLVGQGLTTSVFGTGAFAYKIIDGNRVDVIAGRRATITGDWEIYVDGKTIATDAQYVLLRFADDEMEWSDIDAGAMVQGTRVWYNDEYVVGLDTVAEPSSELGDLSFSADEVVVYTTDPDDLDGYFVGPQIPTTAAVNGELDLPVQMFNVPHPLMSEFPPRVGRSPNNNTVDVAYKYSIPVTLRNWSGEAIEGWPTDRAEMEIHGLYPNPSVNAPDAASNSSGEIEWTDGLDTGGSFEEGEGAVVLRIDYDGDSTFRVAKRYLSISSPDQNGDNDVDAADEWIWSNAYVNHSPLYQGDLNLSNVISLADGTWLQEHGD